ncbi:ATP-grasp domain-containing protein [Paenibacillus sp. P25]|nr:ATP-grasp domain-containing protein [Paenibacillus sp. P25]
MRAWLSWLKGASYFGHAIVNPVDTLLLHFAKPYQIEVLRSAGIPVPETLVTSRPEELRTFCEQREVVYKPVAGGALCRLVTPQDFDAERLSALQTAPVQFQEYIPGDDLRVFVLNRQAIAAFLVGGEGVDYRSNTTRLEAVSIAPDVAELCVNACDALGLVFSGVDLKLRPDGSVVLIECNPSPMFEGFDRVAPVSVVSQLARYLIETAHLQQKERGKHRIPV